MRCSGFRIFLWQAALERAENAKPSSSQSSQPPESGAVSSGDAASKSKVKQQKKQQQPVAQLLEDQGLNAELDAANTGGLVETERDRLIRIVSTLHATCKETSSGRAVFVHCIQA